MRQHTIKRSATLADVFGFAIPAAVAFFAGLVLSGRDGYDGMLKALWRLIRDPAGLSQLAWNQSVGLGLTVVGLAICFVAAATLGRFYASTLIILQDHRLVTHGIYRFVRHPVYFGALVVCGSVPLYAWSLYGSLAMSALVPLVLNRIRMEERLLSEEFGDLYESYRRTTKMLIPFLY